jgi:tetratricopeptide (TPR) repeat protein
MKIHCLLLFSLFMNVLYAQPPGTSAKGGEPLSTATSFPGITKALVIGISDYQDDGIPDLKYADKDAREFVKYLKSNGGGSLKDDQIRLLTNEQATTAQIYSELDWLMEACGPDDQAVIYFSGHGDVETKTKRQQGFLLAYDTPPTNYMIGALRLNDLNNYLETIVEGKSKIIVITDACHSGNLAGGREGVGATAQALSAQFLNQVKIMSCQPHELSLEGEQWGGGRGVFSFHLIDGLVGMADKNKDSLVTLFELDRYLQETIPTETDQGQFPVTTGNKSAKLVTVDPFELNILIAERSAPKELHPVAPKGIFEALLAAADTTVQQLYGEFQAAVNSRYFLPSDLKAGRQPGRSASELFDRLYNEQALAPMRQIMKRNFATALQDNSQQAINAYLRADPAEMAARWADKIDIGRYKSNPVYIAKAASLLGESHVLYNQLLAKQHYFEGLIKRMEGSNPRDTNVLNEALALEFKALELDSGAAYVYNEIGLIYDEIRLVYKAMENQRKNSELFQKQIDNYEIAITLAPKWIMPYHNAGETYTQWRRFDKAEHFGLMAIALDSNFVKAYDNLGYIYYLSNQFEKGIPVFEKLVQLKPDDKSFNYNLACLNALLHKTNEAVNWLEKAIKLGYSYESIKADGDMDNIRSSDQFLQLMKRYFPDK